MFWKDMESRERFRGRILRSLEARLESGTLRYMKLATGRDAGCEEQDERLLDLEAESDARVADNH